MYIVVLAPKDVMTRRSPHIALAATMAAIATISANIISAGTVSASTVSTTSPMY